MVSSSSQSLRTFGAYFLAWTLAGLFYFSQDLTRILYWHESIPWDDAFSSRMIGTYLCAAFTPILLWAGRHWPIELQNWRTRTPLHLLFSAAFSATELALESIVYPALGVLPSLLHGSFRQDYPVMLVVGFHGNVITYWMVLGLQSGYRYYRQFREREAHAAILKTQLVRAQLSALKMQLQPHFLFNTMNAIMVLVRQQKGRQAEETLGRFSDLLRCVLEDVEAQEVPLRRELEYLRLYLSIEQVRFQDRLEIEISADPSLLDAAVPHMGLQPIVENAVRHGIDQSLAAGRIRISVSRNGGELAIHVQDNGPGLAPAELSDGWGIGLANTRARLQQLHGDAARLTVQNAEGGGVEVIMIVPYRPVNELPAAELMEVHATDDAHRG